MKPEKTLDEAMDSLCQIMLNEWSKEEIIEYIRSRDGYTKNDMTALPIKEFKCKDVYGQEYVLSYTDAPMVEYTPVVRCKACKFCEHFAYGMYICKQGHLIPRDGNGGTNIDWFCADGERKEDA